METIVSGFPPGWKQMLRDFREDEKYFAGFPRECIITVLDFYAASAPASESNVHFFHVQNFCCMLNYNDNAIETSASVVG